MTARCSLGCTMTNCNCSSLYRPWSYSQIARRHGGLISAVSQTMMAPGQYNTYVNIFDDCDPTGRKQTNLAYTNKKYFTFRACLHVNNTCNYSYNLKKTTTTYQNQTNIYKNHFCPIGSQPHSEFEAITIYV